MASKVDILITATDKASGVLGKIGGAFAKMTAAAAAATVAAGVAFGKFALDSAMAAARVEELQVVNQQLAKNAGISSKAVIDAAKAVKSMGIETAISERVISKFVQNNLDIAKASDLARIAQDAAVISGQNSTEALDGLTQGLITLQPEVLRTYGLFVDTQAVYKATAKELGKSVLELTTAEKQQGLLNEVIEKGSDIAGAYEAAMGTASKQIRSWPRYIDDIKVAFGGLFEGQFKDAIFMISSFLKNLGKLFTAFGEWRETGIDFFNSLKLSLLEVFGPGMREQVIPFINQVQEIWNTLRGGNMQPVVDIFSNLFAGATEKIKEGVDSIDWTVMSQSVAEKINSIDWSVAGNALTTGVGNILWGASTLLLEFDWGAMFDSIIQATAEFLTGLFGITFEDVRGTADAFWFMLGMGMANAFISVRETIINVLNSMMTVIVGVIKRI